jgi:hypothetical protein
MRPTALALDLDNLLSVVLVARVRLAITRRRQVISSRKVQTSAEGSCTAGASPRYNSLASRSASLRSFLAFERQISRNRPGCATVTRAAIVQSRSC